MMEDCIADLTFSVGVCFARHIMTKQLLSQDQEKLNENLIIFSGIFLEYAPWPTGSSPFHEMLPVLIYFIAEFKKW